MSDYFEPIKKIINSKLQINHHGYGEFAIYDDKEDYALMITPEQVVYKGYIVPLDGSELEDISTLVGLTYNLQESKNKEKALKELKEKK